MQHLALDRPRVRRFFLILLAIYLGGWALRIGLRELPEDVATVLLFPLNWVVPIVLVARWGVLGWLDGIAGALAPKYALVATSWITTKIALSQAQGRDLSPDCKSGFAFDTYILLFFPVLLLGMMASRYFLIGDRIRVLMDRIPLATSPPVVLVDRLIGVAINSMAAAFLWALVMNQGDRGGHHGPWTRWVFRLVDGFDGLLSHGVLKNVQPVLVPGDPTYFSSALEIRHDTHGSTMGLKCPTEPGFLPWWLPIASAIVFAVLGSLILIVGCDPILYRNTRTYADTEDDPCPDCGRAGLYGLVASPAHPLRGRLLRGILCRRCLGTGTPAKDGNVPVNPRNLEFTRANGNPGALLTTKFVGRAVIIASIGNTAILVLDALQVHVH